jgi:UDP-N-acetylglucosamine acyltransferase
MIHKSAIIGEGAKIADDVTIGPFCYIGKDVKLSQGCRLESNVILRGKLNIAKNVKIFSFTTIGHEKSDIKIGKNTHIREFVQIGVQEDENKKPKKIIIANDNFLMGYVQILSGVETGEFSIFTNAVRLYENVKCHERVVVGGLSSIEANKTIGTGVMIGGASYVDKDIPPFTLVEGNKATIKGLNVVGLRRRLENKDDIEEIKLIFKKVLGKGVDKELASKLAKTHENEYVRIFSEFIVNSDV